LRRVAFRNTLGIEDSETSSVSALNSSTTPSLVALIRNEWVSTSIRRHQ